MPNSPEPTRKNGTDENKTQTSNDNEPNEGFETINAPDPSWKDSSIADLAFMNIPSLLESSFYDTEPLSIFCQKKVFNNDAGFSPYSDSSPCSPSLSQESMDFPKTETNSSIKGIPSLRNVLSGTYDSPIYPEIGSESKINPQVIKEPFDRSKSKENSLLNNPNPMFKENSLFTKIKREENNYKFRPARVEIKPEKSLIEKERKRKRAEKSREARIKKKIYVSHLEDEIKQLQKELENHRRKVCEVKDESIESHTESKKTELIKDNKDTFMFEKINEENPLLKKKIISIDVDGVEKKFAFTEEEIKRLCKKFICNPNERLLQANYYLDRVFECILPGDQVKFLIFALTQNEAFYQNSVHRNILKGLNIPENKIDTALKSRDKFLKDKKKIDDLLAMLKGLRQDIENHLIGVSELANSIRSILSPMQIMRFFLWTMQDECKEIMNRLDYSSSFTNPCDS